ncbi:MAG: hypothetical protein IJI83_03070 [Oscillospiraceae bacterium]|nr:hypothetical protein [Oscillospiraceae bacterium]
MRDQSIISIIRRYGLNSKRLDPKYRIRYAETLEDLSSFSNGTLKLINVIDNMASPDKSLSSRCMIPGCNKHIRIENHVEDTSTGDIIVCGSNCCCTLLGLSKLQQKKLHSIEEALKEKAELEKWKEDNPRAVEKLRTLEKYNLPFYRPFVEEVKNSALTPEDTNFINDLNLKLVIGDQKYLDAISELLKYDQKEIYKSIRDHVLVQGRYLSSKQKQFISNEYERMLKSKTETIFTVSGGYDFREQLKELGFQFNHRDKTWNKTVKTRQAADLKNRLDCIGIPEENIITR